ncbi:MAG TPA: phage protein Gp37 [Roseomonas sp.]|jgi:phage gp37-like protein
MTIAAVEDQIIARLATAFDGRLCAVEHRPAGIDNGAVVRSLLRAPGICVTFLGWQASARADAAVTASWTIYLIATNASGEAARRRGDAATIGAYEMLEVTARSLDRWLPAAAAGAASVLRADMLDPASLHLALDVASPVSTGRSAYLLTLAVPLLLTGPDAGPPLSVDPFVTFHADWDVPVFGNVTPPLPAAAPDAADTVTLPQG